MFTGEVNMDTGDGSLRASGFIKSSRWLSIGMGWYSGLGNGGFRMSIAEDGIDGGCFCLLIPSFASEAKRKHTDCMDTCAK
jgi:hypothetical protein